jgi:predicted GIY-YIG superfamily endonuclease
LSKVYLLHFLQPIGNLNKPKGSASHYLGSTSKSLKQRFQSHHNGTGAKITSAFKKAGIDFICVRTWDGGRELERYLKRRHNHKLLCPICNPNAMNNGNQMGKIQLKTRKKL